MTYITFHTVEIKSLGLFFFPCSFFSKALWKVKACQCPYGAMVGVPQGNCCSFFFAFQNR